MFVQATKGEVYLTSATSNISLINYKGKVSLDRVGNFLKETELLDHFAKELESGAPASFSSADENTQISDHNDLIGFSNAMFTWSNDVATDGSQTPSSRVFKLRVDGTLTFKKGCINLIIGPT